MQLSRKHAVRAALVAAFTLAAAAPGRAQATPIVSGHLKGGPTPAAQSPSIIDLTIHLVELPDGSLVGGGRSTKQDINSWFRFELTSYVFLGDTLFAAGPVTAVHATQGAWEVGDTYFVAVKDNGDGNGPVMDEFIEGRVPASYGPMTIQQILAIVGPPPPAFFRQGISGNLTLH